ncbi:unnamed protein product [marine sediment metagenome]|uniref:Uncharacterized protein n=1 Tax=marine sediment metagenome TaxID=412755 RepID=X1R4R7_9ZZZZ
MTWRNLIPSRHLGFTLLFGIRWEAIFKGDWVSVKETGILYPVFSRKNLIISIVCLPISVSSTGR